MPHSDNNKISVLFLIYKMKKIKIAIAGVGNCASSLIQGLEFYKNHSSKNTSGIAFEQIGGYQLKDIQVVCAFDIDERKVGRPLEEAVFAKPNCTKVFCEKLSRSGVTVVMGPVLDGIAPHMESYPEGERFKISKQKPTRISEELQKSGAEILLCYLPVGSEEAVKHYAKACLQAKVALVNCVPVFIAS